MSEEVQAASLTRTMTRESDEWPDYLNDIGALRVPDRLYLRGRRLDVGEHAVAIVGARRPTAAGIEVADQLARDLAEAGLSIVSGMAVGIDTVAHRAALSVGGYTVGVAGCGLDIDYPRANRKLRDQIREQGTVVSEHPDGTQPQPQFYPERNRIIAGMCEAVIFVEGTFKSGGLITARFALDANRSVFAVPGSVRNVMASGPNNLIRTSQASLCTDAQHVFEDLAPKWAHSSRIKIMHDRVVVLDSLEPQVPVLGDGESQVLRLLDDAPLTADDICDHLGAPFGVVALALAKLEARGMAVKRAMGYEITRTGARARAALAAHGP